MSEESYYTIDVKLIVAFQTNLSTFSHFLVPRPLSLDLVIDWSAACLQR